jgi:hypothetical protein
MPNGNNPAANQTLATDPNVLWRATKITLEVIARKLGIRLANTEVARAITREAQEMLGGDLPPHWMQTGAGILTAAFLQSPRFVSNILSRFSGMDENKLHSLLNEALDAGILSAALQAERNANRPATAQDVGPGALREIRKIIAKLEGNGRFKDLQKEKGDAFSDVLTRMSRWGDDEERALAEAYLVAEHGATAHQRKVIQDIGQRKSWSVDDIFVALRHATVAGQTSLESFIAQMERKESRGRIRKATGFVGAALTGDRGNPDYRHFQDGMGQMTRHVEENAGRIRRHADELEAQRHGPGLGVFGLLNMLNQRWNAFWRSVFR